MSSTGLKRRAGFTLIEVLLTITIMALLLVAISEMLTATRNTRDSIQNMQETQLAGPAILDMIERDLRGVLTLNLPRTSNLRLNDRVLLGQDADRLDFITTNDNINWTENGDRWVRADCCEVGYCLRPNPDNDEFLELYRREQFGVDGEPFEGGNFTFLHDRVKSFDVRAFQEDGEEAEPLDEWNQNTTDPETQGLPARLEIVLVLELAPRLIREQLLFGTKEQRTIEYRRIWRIPESLRLELNAIPRLAIPVVGGEAEAADAPTDENSPNNSPEGNGEPNNETEGAGSGAEDDGGERR